MDQVVEGEPEERPPVGRPRCLNPEAGERVDEMGVRQEVAERV
jgi:hypothetical protein